MLEDYKLWWRKSVFVEEKTFWFSKIEALPNREGAKYGRLILISIEKSQHLRFISLPISQAIQFETVSTVVSESILPSRAFYDNCGRGFPRRFLVTVYHVLWLALHQGIYTDSWISDSGILLYNGILSR